MTNIELTDIERETFPALPQLYDLVETAPGQRIKIVREKETRPYNVEENAILSGDETVALVNALSRCDVLFPTKEIHCAPDGIALDIDYGRRKYRKGEHPSPQSTLLDMEDFCDEQYATKLNLTVYFSGDCWLSLHVLNAKKDNTKGRVFFRWPVDKKYQGCIDLDLTMGIRDVFVLAQEIVMKKAINGELRGIDINNG